MNTERSYPAKLLLFGEYLVLLSGEALAIPIHNYSGQLHQSTRKVTYGISSFLTYIREQLSWELVLQTDIEHYSFDSNIPVGYGVGSSGALTAAVYDQLLNFPTEELKDLRDSLAQMESFFHGSSSGFDPLISYLDKTVLKTIDKYQLIDLSESSKVILDKLFLFDTGISRSTEPLVGLFKEKLLEKDFRAICEGDLMEKNSLAINAFLSGKMIEFEQNFIQISMIQFEYFQEMIPEPCLKQWEEGLESGKYFFKFCGAGGGGFFIVYVSRDVEAEEEKNEFLNGLIPIKY